jgi:hypothetical protein
MVFSKDRFKDGKLMKTQVGITFQTLFISVHTQHNVSKLLKSFFFFNVITS